jgi:hypothetical protein
MSVSAQHNLLAALARVTGARAGHTLSNSAIRATSVSGVPTSCKVARTSDSTITPWFACNAKRSVLQ